MFEPGIDTQKGELCVASEHGRIGWGSGGIVLDIQPHLPRYKPSVIDLQPYDTEFAV